MKIERKFWIAISADRSYAHASMISEPDGKHEKKHIAEFFKNYAGKEIKLVGADEMAALVKNHPRFRATTDIEAAIGEGV